VEFSYHRAIARSPAEPTFLQDVEVFVEDVADERRRAAQELVARQLQQSSAAQAELRADDVLQRELVYRPVQPLQHLRLRPQPGVCRHPVDRQLTDWSK